MGVDLDPILDGGSVMYHICLAIFCGDIPLHMLVGGLEHSLCFHILGIIIPIDSYFSEGLKPPTSMSFIYIYIYIYI